MDRRKLLNGIIRRRRGGCSRSSKSYRTTTVERVVNGQIILPTSDPFFRGYFVGSGRSLLKAIVLGPGLGASQPIPL